MRPDPMLLGRTQLNRRRFPLNPIIRMLGRVLRLVGISSPEDSLPRESTAGDPPSWRAKRSSEALGGTNAAEKSPPGETGSTT